MTDAWLKASQEGRKDAPRGPIDKRKFASSEVQDKPKKARSGFGSEYMKIVQAAAYFFDCQKEDIKDVHFSRDIGKMKSRYFLFLISFIPIMMKSTDLTASRIQYFYDIVEWCNKLGVDVVPLYVPSLTDTQVSLFSEIYLLPKYPGLLRVGSNGKFTHGNIVKTVQRKLIPTEQGGGAATTRLLASTGANQAAHRAVKLKSTAQKSKTVSGGTTILASFRSHAALELLQEVVMKTKALFETVFHLNMNSDQLQYYPHIEMFTQLFNENDDSNYIVILAIADLVKQRMMVFFMKYKQYLLNKGNRTDFFISGLKDIGGSSVSKLAVIRAQARAIRKDFEDKKGNQGGGSLKIPLRKMTLQPVAKLITSQSATLTHEGTKGIKDLITKGVMELDFLKLLYETETCGQKELVVLRNTSDFLLNIFCVLGSIAIQMKLKASSPDYDVRDRITDELIEKTAKSLEALVKTSMRYNSTETNPSETEQDEVTQDEDSMDNYESVDFSVTETNNIQQKITSKLTGIAEKVCKEINGTTENIPLLMIITKLGKLMIRLARVAVGFNTPQFLSKLKFWYEKLEIDTFEAATFKKLSVQLKDNYETCYAFALYERFKCIPSTLTFEAYLDQTKENKSQSITDLLETSERFQELEQIKRNLNQKLTLDERNNRSLFLKELAQNCSEMITEFNVIQHSKGNQFTDYQPEFAKAVFSSSSLEYTLKDILTECDKTLRNIKLNILLDSKMIDTLKAIFRYLPEFLAEITFL